MEIREYQEKDKKGILELQDEFEKEFFSEFYSNPIRAEWELDLHNIPFYFLKKGGNFWVIEKNNEIIGMTGIILVGGNTAELTRMRIRSSHRRQGLGKKLLITVENYCRSLGISTIVLNTAARLNAARKLYENHGYELYDKKEILLPFRFIILYYRKHL
ncbi:MAG: GNAT family N-acetyltransferase [Candidatus Hermodarchaeota archaeon]